MLKSASPERVEKFLFFSTIRWKVVYSKVFPVLTALLFDFWGNNCRYVHAGVCKQKADQKLKVHLGWHTEMSLGLGLTKTLSAPVRKVRLPHQTARLAYQMLYVCTLPSCILNLVFLIRQPSSVLPLDSFSSLTLDHTRSVSSKTPAEPPACLS